MDFARAIHIAIEVEEATKVAKETVCGQKPKLVNKVNHLKPPPHTRIQDVLSRRGSRIWSTKRHFVGVVDRRTTKSELDTGATAYFITEELWHKLGTPPLQETREHYASASQHKMSIVGEFVGNASSPVAERGCDIRLIVTTIPDLNLLGRDAV
ncbi:hypothetical protein O3P69_017564 [Scylla paramamosain]|uniref:Uncharacterized protein n=1 Tax=Scylla paramamosain TaxID=85552 RepID=A0AAW0TZH2_SCYPA